MSVTRDAGNKVVIARIAKQSRDWHLRSTARATLVRSRYRLFFKTLEPHAGRDCLPKRFERARLFAGYPIGDKFHQ